MTTTSIFSRRCVAATTPPLSHRTPSQTEPAYNNPCLKHALLYIVSYSYSSEASFYTRPSPLLFRWPISQVFHSRRRWSRLTRCGSSFPLRRTGLGDKTANTGSHVHVHVVLRGGVGLHAGAERPGGAAERGREGGGTCRPRDEPLGVRQQQRHRCEGLCFPRARACVTR